MNHITLKEKIGELVFIFISGLISVFPRSICLRLGCLLGEFFFYFDYKHRRIALKNLSIAFGQTNAAHEINRLARSSFCWFGQMIFDLLKFSRLDEEKKSLLIEIEGKEHLQNALNKGKGVLLFSAHFGNWEAAVYSLSRLGKLNVIARPLDNRLLEKRLLKLRRNFGTEVIYKFEAAKPVLRKLRSNEMVAILIDQNVLRSQAVFVDFFGRKAATTPALAAFALRTESPILPVFCTPISKNKYKVAILPPVKFNKKESPETAMLKITQQCTKIIESCIRKSPDYWLWFHNRWKTRPSQEFPEQPFEAAKR